MNAKVFLLQLLPKQNRNRRISLNLSSCIIFSEGSSEKILMKLKLNHPIGSAQPRFFLGFPDAVLWTYCGLNFGPSCETCGDPRAAGSKRTQRKGIRPEMASFESSAGVIWRKPQITPRSNT